MKTISLLLLVLLQSQILFGQHKECPYELNKKKELLYSGSGLLLTFTGLILRQSVSPLTVTEINELDISSVNSFDRKTVSSYSIDANNCSDHLQIIGWVMPFAFAIPKETRKDFWTIGLMTLETVLLTNGVTSILKGSTQRIRPYAYNEDAPIDAKTKVETKLSFFSGHTSNYAALSFFSAKIIADYSDKNKVKILAFSTAAVSSAYMGYLRVKSGNHFMTDVIVGYAVGAAIGIAIPHLHKKHDEDRKLSFTPFYNNETMGLHLTWALN
jgi:hypothetical protein